MADATAAARDRVDRALATLERRVLQLKARPASAPPVTDDDLFASAPGDHGREDALAARIEALEVAGHAASRALAEAADTVRDLIAAAPPAVEKVEADDAGPNNEASA